MEKKYKTESDPSGLLRIIALKDFSDVKKGDKGGLIQNEANLSQEGDCWIYEDAQVSGNAQAYGDACILGHARVSGFAKVYEKAKVFDEAMVGGHARIWGNVQIGENAKVYGRAQVSENASIYGSALVHDNAKVYGRAQVFGWTNIYDNVSVYGEARIGGVIILNRHPRIQGKIKLWATMYSYIDTSIENNKDYVMLVISDRNIVVVAKDITESRISLPSQTEDITAFTITALDYIENIQTIRQLYEEI
jgi:NDP-sugar pyrophosphorylase family protein